MSHLWKLVILPALFVLVNSDIPLPSDFDDSILRNEVDATIYRIPEGLDPIHYDVEITPYFEAEGVKEAFSFDGTVTLTIRAVEDDITVLTIQENVRSIVSITLTNEAGTPILVNETRPFFRERNYHYLRIYLRDGVTLMKDEIYLLTIVYVGNINETPLSRGIFRGYYTGTDGRTHWYAASHLQPTHSRQAFPSFDEPGFKSTFTITINRPAHFNPTFSNMQIREQILFGNRVKEIFYPTPRMSAYLVTIHISEEFTVIADNNDPERSYRILARPDAAGQGDYALEVGPPITEWLENYFKIPYYTMGEDMKNDQIAVPDWASGATENWGLVSYRELRLLYEEGETNAVDKMAIGTITAHELAHKWFGNLVTCRWWDNVWINEGFASYFEYFAMDAVDKSMELEDQFIVSYMHSALSADSSTATRALQHTVNTPTEVTGHFSGISYSKGASLLLMLRHFVSDDTFELALKYFLDEMSYKHAYPTDLYRSFADAVQDTDTVDPNVDIAELIRYWVEEPGYPVLTVNVNMETGQMNLRQDRFFISPSAQQTEQVWPLPLTYTTGNNANWDNLTPTHVMTGRTDELTKDPGHDWVIFNVKQKGIYRVNYDTHNWEMLIDVLKNNPSNIHYLNRAQIVDDVFAFMRAEIMTYELGFQILDFLKEETSYFAWYPAISGFSWIRNRFRHLPDVLEEFTEILYEFIDAVVTDLGYEVIDGEPLTRTLNRFYILDFACGIGHEGCITDALTKWNNFKNGAELNPNIRRHVFCQGLHEGSYEDWDFLYKRYLDGNNQAARVAMLRGLGCSTDERAVQEYLQNILDDSIVKAQDRANAFTFLYIGDRANTRPALEFLKENIDEIRTKVILPANFNSVLTNLASYMDEDGLKEMEDWLNENRASIPEYSTGINAIASARNNMQWGTDRADIILAAARDSAIVILPTALLLFTTLIALFLN